MIPRVDARAAGGSYRAVSAGAQPGFKALAAMLPPKPRPGVLTPTQRAGMQLELMFDRATFDKRKELKTKLKEKAQQASQRRRFDQLADRAGVAPYQP
jgi:hypothetical protein